MSEIQTSEYIARWLIHEDENRPGLAFETFESHRCKLCGDPVARREQKRHLTGHRRELERIADKRRNENTNRLKQTNRLRREANRA